MKNLHKIQAVSLKGRGGAEFSVAFKWLSTLKAKVERFDEPSFVICNAMEGEPGVNKDKFIIQHYPQEVIHGIKIALDELGAKKAFIYCAKKDLKKIKTSLEPFTKNLPISFFAQSNDYLAGEETTLLEVMEGKRAEPRLKPPFPSESGFFNHPTLINNVETFYYISKISKGEYNQKRFYSISGNVLNPGVFEQPIDYSIYEVLKKTKNIPRGKYFVQAGGGAAGIILTMDELKKPLQGTGSIIVYDLKKTNTKYLAKKWINFFFKENCGKCAPCREGLFRLKKELEKEKPDWLMIRAILETMRDASLCPLGKSVYDPLFNLLVKIGIE